MSITIELPADALAGLLAYARAEGREPASVAADVLAATFGTSSGEAADPAAVTEIRAALESAQRDREQGRLLPVDAAFAELEARAARRRQERQERQERRTA